MNGTKEICHGCGRDMVWRVCPNCEDGFNGHDCGEDCCCCVHPQPNVPCDTCEGKGGWWICTSCH